MKNYPNEIDELILEFDAARMFFAEEEEEEASFVVSLKDITERKRAEEAVRESEEYYRMIIENSNDMIWTLDTEGRFLFFNKRSEQITGYRLEDWQGKSFAPLIYKEDIPKVTEVFHKILSGQPQQYEVSVIRKDGSKLILSVNSAPIYSKAKVVGTVSFGRDVTEQKEAEEQIKKSLKEKEILLGEIHHRVKNNMQVISSMLSLQSEYITEEKYRDMFQESQNRILSMSLIHENLYQSRNFAKIDLNEYINDLVNDLFRYYGIDTGNITLNINVENVYLGIDSGIPCGFIINELVTNSLKHAFPDGRKGEIYIAFSQNNENIYELFVGDNGVSIPEDLDIGNTESLGLQLVTMLVKDQLEGEIDLNRNNGTKFRIKFKGEN